MKVGDVKRIKGNQDYTVASAQHQLCIIEEIDRDGIMHVRLETPDGSHYRQYAREEHLE